jgi:hypothetical protein
MSTTPRRPKIENGSHRPAQRLPKALARPARPPGRIVRPAGGRVVVAVLGSVAALGGATGSAAAAGPPATASAHRPARAARRADPIPAGELALLGLVFASLAAAAPAIARPLLDRGVAGQTITQAEADAFVARLAAVDATPAADSAAGVAPSTPTPAAIALFQSVFNAIRAQLPLVAKPLVRDALAAGTIDQAQADRIDQRMLVRAHLRIAGLPNAHTEPLFTGRLP